jgi:hypothetical protein
MNELCTVFIINLSHAKFVTTKYLFSIMLLIFSVCAPN